jgi:hypothetical protein
MSIWADRRKQTIIWVIILLIFGVLGVGAWTVFHVPPTCDDRKMNQDEQGVDCGGECNLICRDMAASPIILWNRFFKISDGVYTGAAMIQNPNLYAYAPNVPYLMRLYDDEGVTIYERNGFVTLYPKYTFPLIQPGIRTLERVPVRMTFEFIAEPVWYVAAEQATGLSITNDVIYNETSSPRIDAVIRNDGNKPQQDVKAAAIVYGTENNAIAVSQTFVDIVPSNGSAKIVFSWPEPFETAIVRKELIILP